MMRRMAKFQLDKYARDARAWSNLATINYLGSMALFTYGNPVLYLPAATLGHHALEMYLKAALISEGMTVFDPAKLKYLDPAYGLKKADCVWGHVLKEQARQLAAKRSEFDLSAPLYVPDCAFLQMPMKLEDAFGLFDPFFSELRYPREMKGLKGVGEGEWRVLVALVEVLNPLLCGVQ
jgi:hypothetical protein